MPSYHEMLCIYRRASEQKGIEVERNLQRLGIGLQKLQSTRISVENMQHELQELLRRKDHTKSDMDRLLLSISQEQEQLDNALEEVAHDERVAAEEAETCKRLAQEAQEQVQEVAPEV
jgi:translation initiation factor 2B subunit (eIF-2B alpha/beta/delta family)